MRLLTYLLIVIIATGGVACVKKISHDQQFETTANGFIEEFLKLNPQRATALGDHRFDNTMGDYSATGRKNELDMLTRYRDLLGEIDSELLTETNMIDHAILFDQIESSIYSLDTLRSWAWNPRAYGVAGGIYSLLSRDFAPLEQRMTNVASRLEEIPAILETAKRTLDNPPQIYTETALRQNPGAIALVRDEINARLEEVPQMTELVKPAQEAAIKALEEYGVWLKDDLLPRSNGDFRLGEEKFKRKLSYTLNSEFTPEQILAMAETDLVETQTALYETALPLYDKLFSDKAEALSGLDHKQVIKLVLDRLADDHPTAETVVELAKVALFEAEQFVREHELVTMPTEPIEIIVMPEFQRGVAIAYCDSPGPFDKNAKTFYAIAPPPKDMSAELQESRFREDNNYMIRDLTVHEAMPGHYLQLAHANKFTAPTMVRSIFGSGPFIEGWACYSESLMADAGFGGPEVKMQQLKMWLRVITNAIIDQKIHAGNMTQTEAIDLMMNEGFQEKAAARGKWRRALLTSTQLSTYYVGTLGIKEIVRAHRAKHGESADMKVMHDEMLSFGSPPARYVKQMMGLK